MHEMMATSSTIGRPLARPPPGGGGGRFISGGGGAAAIAKRSRPMVGTFEENVLNNRLEPIRTVDGYVADVRASSNLKQPVPMRSGLRVSFYSVDGCFPYLGQLNLGHRGYKIPKKGTLQVALFNPNGTLVKLFLLHYDLTDMPPNSQTFLRQKTLFLPTKSAPAAPAAPAAAAAATATPATITTIPTTANTMLTPTPTTHKVTDTLNGHKHNLRHLELDQNSNHVQTTNRTPLMLSAPQTRVILRDKTSKNSQKPQNLRLPQQSSGQLAAAKSRLKYLIQLNIVSSKSGRIYLNKDLRIFVSKKVDLETASQFTKQHYELKSFDEMPSNPKYFSR